MLLFPLATTELQLCCLWSVGESFTGSSGFKLAAISVNISLRFAESRTVAVGPWDGDSGESRP